MSRHYDFIQEVKNLPFNIKNIFDWSKVLWNNFDWGGNFLLEIMEYKLQRMKRYMEVDTVIIKEEADKDVAEIDLCLDALKHLISNDYEHNLIVNYQDKYPEKYKDIETFFDNINKPMGKVEKIDWDKMNNDIKELEEKYKHQLFDTLREKYNWWGD
jgi:hypothetical protein